MPAPFKSVLPTLALVATLACVSAPAPLSPADRAANRALSQRFATLVLAKDWDGAAKLYADSALFLPPNAPAFRGPAGVRSYLAAFPPLSELTLVDDTIVGDGDRAFVYGTYHLTLAIKGSPVDSGKFLDIRERQKDGSWLYVADMFNSNVPLPAAH